MDHVEGRETIDDQGGGYILSMYRSIFVNIGLRENHHGTDYILILVVLRGEVMLCNHFYQRERMCQVRRGQQRRVRPGYPGKPGNW